MTEEIWKPVVGWEGLYEISNLGQIRSLPRFAKNGYGMKLQGGNVLKQIIARTGYAVVNCSRPDGTRKQLLLHREVLRAFVGECPLKFQACHNNGVRNDNRLENLRWDSVKANHADKKEHGTWQGGIRNSFAKLNDELVRYIRSSPKKVRELAEQIGVSKNCIEQVRSYKSWKHI